MIKIVATQEDFKAHLKELEAQKEAKKNCTHPYRTDLTRGKGEVRNIYCPTCDWHLYKGKEYTKEEWNKWINDPKGYK